MNKRLRTQDQQQEPWETPWPADGLEAVSHCPVCGAADSALLHSDLLDNVFFVAPGKWNLWQCSGCGSAYLDPCPSPETLHLAYASYYTHKQPADKDDYDSLSLFRRLRRRLVNGYTHWRFGAKDQPASVFGVAAAFAMPNLRRLLDRQYRHLPRLPEQGGKLLDVGSGDGSFLRLAKGVGWDVIGVDPDPKAAANAAQQGLSVSQGGIEYFDGESEVFDVITLNHVIEHVYEPLMVLKRCHALLRPGGQLWLETPNIDSYGHARFGTNWRGLETPRHLVLFNLRSLRQAIVEVGFSRPSLCSRPSPSLEMAKAGCAMEQGGSPYHPSAVPGILRLWVAMTVCVETYNPSRREFLTFKASKDLG